jgi:hypothetical protein
MNQFSMGYNNGFYNGLMMNQMMNNQMYFNSLDNNSLQPIIKTPVGVNVGGGSVFKIAQPTLAEQFTKEIPNHSNPIITGKDQLSSPQVNQPAINSGVTKPVTGNNLTNSQPAIAAPQNSLSGKDGKPLQSIAPEQVKPGTITQSKPTNSQQNKNDLINSGVNSNNNVAPTRAPVNNYTSAPSTKPAIVQEPIRSNNLTTPNVNTQVEYNNANRPERPQPIKNQTNTEVSPKIGSGNIVRDNNSTSPQPAVNQQRNNYQQYQSPQNFNRPNNTEQTPQQRPNYQQYNNQQQDRNNQNNSNQQNKSNQNQQYRAPQQRNNYTEPRQERNNYSQPRQERNNYSQPRQEYQAPRQQPRESNRGGSDYSAPRQNSSPSNKSFESAPRNNSGGGNSNSSGSFNGGGNKMNSPRR